MAFNSLEEFLQSIKTSYTEALESHINFIRKQYEPFVWDSVKDHLEEISEKHKLLLSVHEESLRKLLESDGEYKFEFKDPKFTEMNQIEQYAENLTDSRAQELQTFLNKQRIISNVTVEEFQEIKKAALEVFDFEFISHENKEFEKQKIIFIIHDSVLDNFVCFFSNEKVVIYDNELYEKDVFTHNFGHIISVDSFEGVISIANIQGKLTFVSGPKLTELSVTHFSMLNNKTNREHLHEKSRRTVHQF